MHGLLKENTLPIYITLLEEERGLWLEHYPSDSYFLAGVVINGGTVTIEGCGTSSLQVDLSAILSESWTINCSRVC